MPREFKYDVVQLIRCVRDRPCLWDKSLECYKDRIERRTAWEELFAILDPRYDEMSPADKKITGEHIMNKWTNIRDTFVKTLKTGAGKKKKKKYMLHNHLEFLVRVVAENACNSEERDYSSADADGTDDGVQNTVMKYEKDAEKEPSPVNFTRKRPKKRESEEEYKESQKEVAKDYDKRNDLDFVEVEVNDPRIMNEDEAFFASLLPTVVRYSEDERLEFRIEVLSLMKRIKENRMWTNNT